MDLICAGLIAVITAFLVVVLPKYFKKPLPVIWSGYTAPGWEKVRQVYKWVRQYPQNIQSPDTTVSTQTLKEMKNPWKKLQWRSLALLPPAN